LVVIGATRLVLVAVMTKFPLITHCTGSRPIQIDPSKVERLRGSSALHWGFNPTVLDRSTALLDAVALAQRLADNRRPHGRDWFTGVRVPASSGRRRTCHTEFPG